MTLTKTHTVVKFKESDWMETYINFNSEKRINVTDSFEKNFV